MYSISDVENEENSGITRVSVVIFVATGVKIMITGEIASNVDEILVLVVIGDVVIDGMFRGSPS